MKIEVMVDKDNTHFSYKFDCDKVINGSRSRVTGGGMDDNAKLVIMKKTGNKEDLVNGFEKKVGEQDELKVIAVFNHWTFWRVIEDTEACQSAESEANEPSDKRGIKRR